MSDIPEIPSLQDDPHLTPIVSTSSHSLTRNQIVLILLGVVVVLLLVGLGLWTRRGGSEPEASPAPTLLPDPTQTPESLINAPLPTHPPSPITTPSVMETILSSPIPTLTSPPSATP